MSARHISLCGKKNGEKKTMEKKEREAEIKHCIKWFFFYANTILFEQQSKATKAKHHEQQQI